MDRLFETVKMEGNWWGVFLGTSDARFLVTSTFAKKSEADHFTEEFNRIASRPTHVCPTCKKQIKAICRACGWEAE